MEHTVCKAGDGETHLLRLEHHLWLTYTRYRLFLIEGVLTVGLAIVFAFYLPNSPRKILGFSETEHEWLRWNYESDQKQQDNSHEITAKQGILMAVRDPKTWLMMGTLYATYTAAAVNNFFPTVVGGLGFSRNASYGLTAVSARGVRGDRADANRYSQPPFVLCVICMLIVGFDSDKVSKCVLIPK